MLKQHLAQLLGRIDVKALSRQLINQALVLGDSLVEHLPVFLQGLDIHLHAAEALLSLGVGRRQRHILLIIRNQLREPGDLLRVLAVHQLLQGIYLIQVAGFQHIEPRHLHIQVAFLDNKRVSGGQCFDFRIAESGFVHIIRHTDRGLAGHNLSDKLLLVLHELVEVSVKGAFRYIPIDFHLFVFISLADDTPQPLLQVGGPPGAV